MIEFNKNWKEKKKREIQSQWLEEVIIKRRKRSQREEMMAYGIRIPPLIVLKEYVAALGKYIEFRINDEE